MEKKQSSSKFNIPKKLTWNEISTTKGELLFDCPNCLEENLIDTSIFDNKNNQLPENVELSETKFGYLERGVNFIANIIAFAITLGILAIYYGEALFITKYNKFIIYLVGIPLMIGIGYFIRMLFTKRIPVWITRCEHCDERLILASDTTTTYLAHYITVISAINQTTTKANNKNTITKKEVLWTLKNGDKYNKSEAAKMLIHSKSTNEEALELILEQAKQENSKSDKNNILDVILLNFKKLKSENSSKTLINNLSCDDEYVRRLVIRLLGDLPEKEVFDSLVKARKTNNEEDRKLIEKAISRIKKKHNFNISEKIIYTKNK